MPQRRVVVVGTTDVDGRVELMRGLRSDFALTALGVSDAPRKRFENAGFEYHKFELPRGVSPFGDLRAYFQLINRFRALRPDIVHTFDTKPNVWARLAALTTVVPVVIGTVTGLGVLYIENSAASITVRKLYETLQSAACHSSDMTIFQNSEDMERFLDTGIAPKDRVMLLPGSGVSTQQFAPESVSDEAKNIVRRDAGVRPGEVVVTMMSRVCRSKGVLEYAEAASAIRRRYPHSRFLLVGQEDTFARDALTPVEIQRVKRLVTWMGQRSDTAAVYAVTDIAVLPSYREGMPRALLEAASMGLPLVATDVPGCRQIVKNGYNGVLTPARDPAGLARAIAGLIEDKDKRNRFGSCSRSRAITEFDISILVQRTAELYRHLCRESETRTKRAATAASRL